MVIAVPNEMGFCRLGLSVSRKVGNSVKRHHIKRLLREAFRLVQHEFPGAYDLIIVIRPHTVWELAEYQKTLLHVVGKLHKRWEKLAQQDQQEQQDDSQGPLGV